jgi:hypothetical protein
VAVDAGRPAAAALDVAEEVARGCRRSVVEVEALEALVALARLVVAALSLFHGDARAGAGCCDHVLHRGSALAARGLVRRREIGLGCPLACRARFLFAGLFSLEPLMELFTREAVANFGRRSAWVRLVLEKFFAALAVDALHPCAVRRELRRPDVVGEQKGAVFRLDLEKRTELDFGEGDAWFGLDCKVDFVGLDAKRGTT